MGAKVNLAKDPEVILSGNDSVVIRQYNGGITGGRSLDMTGFQDSVIKAGHLIIKVQDEDGENYTFKPMPVKEGKYDALPSNHKYVGVAVASKPATEPLVGIMDDGRVNDLAMPYPLTEEMRKEIKAELPKLIFEHD